MGETGPDKGKGAKYLILGPGQEAPADVAGYTVIKSELNNLMFGVRSLEPDPEKSRAMVAKLAIYPYSRRANPPATHFLTPEGRQWTQGQPRCLAFWLRLHAILQEEPV